MICTALMIGCGDKIDLDSNLVKPIMTVSDSSAIDSLKTKYIFFGHKSVGYNIVDGVEALIEKHHNLDRLALFEIGDSLSINQPGLYHKSSGQNGQPKSKCDAFRNFLAEGRRGDHFDIALFKLCWADFTNQTNVRDLFDYYTNTIDQVTNSFPNLLIIHVTVPIYKHTRGLRGFAKDWLRPDIANVKRNQFNELLNERYFDHAPIYDLAKRESTRPDGGRSTFVFEGETYYSLYEKYTDDGGHLNALGKEMTAAELLHILAKAATKAR